MSVIRHYYGKLGGMYFVSVRMTGSIDLCYLSVLQAGRQQHVIVCVIVCVLEQHLCISVVCYMSLS